MRTEGQGDKWQQEEQVLCDSGKTFFHLHSVRFAHTGEPASDVGCGVQASFRWVGVGWGRFQNLTSWIKCLSVGSESHCPLEESGINAHMEK